MATAKDRLHRRTTLGQVASWREVRCQPGNFAVFCARLGDRVSLISNIGDDVFGIVREMISESPPTSKRDCSKTKALEAIGKSSKRCRNRELGTRRVPREIAPATS